MISTVIMRCFFTLSLFIFSPGMNLVSESEAKSFIGEGGEPDSYGLEKNVPYGEYYEDSLSTRQKRGWEALDLRGKRLVPFDQLSSEKRGWEPLSFRPKSYPSPYSKRGWEFVNMRYRVPLHGVSRHMTKRAGGLDDSDFNSILRGEGEQISSACWCCKELEQVDCCLDCGRIGDQNREE